MAYPDIPTGPEDECAPEEVKPDTGIEALRGDTHARIEDVRETDAQKLQRLRSEGVLSPHDCDPNFLYQLREYGFPLKRVDLGNQPVVLTRDEFDAIGFIDIVLANGEEIRVDAESMNDDTFILFPDDLGG